MTTKKNKHNMHKTKSKTRIISEESRLKMIATKLAKKMSKDQIIIVNLSGRGDKDVATAAAWFGIDI